MVLTKTKKERVKHMKRGDGLSLEIRSGESIMIGGNISIRVTKMGEASDRLLVKINAPKEMGIIGPNLFKKLEKAAEEANDGEI